MGAPFDFGMMQEPNHPDAMPRSQPVFGPAPASGSRYRDIWGPQTQSSPLSSMPAPTGQSPSMVGSGAESAGTMGSVGNAMAAAGLAMKTVGAYYDALAAQNQIESQALNLDMRSRFGLINARAAEADATYTMQAAARQALGIGMRRAGERADLVASIGARGGSAGTGSAAEVVATYDYGTLLEKYTLDANAIRQREAARLQAVNLRGQADMDAVNAANMRRMGKTINPWISAGTALIGGSGPVIRNWQ